MSNRATTSRHFVKALGQQGPRAFALLGLYALILTACRYLSYEVRFDFDVPRDFRNERLYSLAVNVPIKLGFLLLFRQFGSLLTYFSVPDLIRIAAAMASANLLTYLLRYGFNPGVLSPRGVVLIDFVLAVGALSLMRLCFRIYRERYATPVREEGRGIRRVAVLGAGDAGAAFVGEVQAKPGLGLRPVFFVDDDWRKHGRDLHGIPVLGTPEEIPKLRAEYPIDSCVIAMPSVAAKRLQEIYKLLSSEGLKVEIVPSLSELATGRVQVTKIRPVQVDDLLGRATVDLRSEEVAQFVADKVVMVTGAGGSIGGELCRQLARYNPSRLLLVEQAEGSLFYIESELSSGGYQHLATPLVADILDEPRMRGIFERYRPEIIFHAAAHKHVYMMERQPGEAVKNNTTGTRKLAELAAEYGIEAFVFISTDKAINPTSAMGASKRLAEIQLQALQERLRREEAARLSDGGTPMPGMGEMGIEAGGPQPAGQADRPTNNPERLTNSLTAPRTVPRYIAVRFGNVLGSSGSVIPIFKKQIEAGGPVTVTHPEVTRYFMTIPEAVGLVLQTSVLGKGGEIFVLDMGKPVKIVDLAKQLIELSGLRPGIDIDIEFVGLRPGEKLYEELQHHSENLAATSHPRIMLFTAKTGNNGAWCEECRRAVEDRVGELEPNQLKLAIKKLVPEYVPHLD